ncbi:hypothetical protein GCM10018954_059290 [Kutzneria kofuensis]
MAQRRRRPAARQFWDSTIGKKIVMAVTGAALLGFVFAHMVGNLKTFLGAADLNAYSHWLRTIGEPVLHYEWFLWIMRAGLIVAVVLHITATVQLVRRDHRARPVRYAHPAARSGRPSPCTRCAGAGRPWRCSSSGTSST